MGSGLGQRISNPASPSPESCSFQFPHLKRVGTGPAPLILGDEGSDAAEGPVNRGIINMLM